MIKDWIKECAGHKVSKSSNRLPEIFLIEVGGTVGDIESTHYYEAIRQMIMEEGRENVALIQLAYIMEIGGEQKTKPAQNGIKDLRYTGLQADFVVCRSE
jgi:CTP synthase